MRAVIAILAVLALAVPGLADAGCDQKIACLPGTGANGPCQDGNSENILIKAGKGGRHEVSIKPSHTDAVCTVNVKKHADGFSSTNSTQVAQLTCNSVESLPLEGPADTVWFEIVDNPIGSSRTITGYLLLCD